MSFILASKLANLPAPSRANARTFLPLLFTRFPRVPGSFLMRDRKLPRRLSLEPLESRCLLAGATADLNAGVLNINGAGKNDSIHVSSDAIQLAVSISKHTFRFNAADVAEIHIFGGNGNDWIWIDNSIAVKAVIDGGGGNDRIHGGGGDDTILGGRGNDRINGSLGDDMLNGSAGIDTVSYANAASGVTINLLLSTPQNTGGAGIDTFVSIENVTGSAYDDGIIGSAQANVISGGTGNDTIDAGSSNDMVDGGYGNDLLKGAAGDDVITGGVGSDTIYGGAGADTLSGGTQADRFAYAALSDSTVAASDRITDFAAGDILDVSAIDANAGLAGDQAFVRAAAFTHTAGQFTLGYDAGTNTTTALFDTNGDAAGDMAILFTGNVTALTGTWVL